MDFTHFLWNTYTISVLWLFYIITIISCIVVILSENRNPIRSLAWVIALIFLPGVGLIFYLFFGRSMRGRQLISRHNKRRLFRSRHATRHNLDSLDLTATEKQLVKLTHKVNHAPFTLNNSAEIFTDGKEKFSALKRDILNARESIYIQYYIFQDDALGEEIARLLIDKARQGVEVRVIYDHVGSFSSSSKFFKKMNAGGVKAHPFFRVTFPQLANRINWRNHRKMVIIDHSIGYIGGMNIADRYLSGESWRDTHLRVEGDILESLLYSFCIDWDFLNNNDRITRADAPRQHKIENRTGMQLLTSGPTDEWSHLELTFLRAIAGATKCVYIQTPYFLPTDSLLHALEAASLANVDVRIMLPRKSDSKMLMYASFSYVKRCLQTGIKVYLYEPGMLHSKVMIIDDSFVTTGSVNFDFRSFENNFEGNLLIFDRTLNRRMKDIFFEDLAKCRKLTISQWRKRPLYHRFLESTLRLLSPIL